MDGSSIKKEEQTKEDFRNGTKKYVHGENRERILSKLRFSIYVINFIAVCFVSGVMAYALWSVVGKMEAAEFLRSAKTRPWKPEQIILVSVFGYRAFALFGSLSHGCDGEKEWLRPFCLGAEILACIVTAAGMNLAYNGLVLVMAADMIRGEHGGRQKVLFGLSVVILYTILDFNLVGEWFGMIAWESFLIVFGTGVQAFLRSTRSILISINLVLFIWYTALMIQEEYRERERIQSLNRQLEMANMQLKSYAVEAEKNAKIRERNRLAREIHDTLGHALTGIIAGVDAAVMIMDLAPDAAKKQLEKVSEVAREGMTDVRRSMNSLRPDALEKLELEDAIQKMLKDMCETTKTEIIFRNQVHPLRFHEDEEEVIYRVIQEAMTNAIRHGKASHIDIAISKVDQWLTIAVKDNGCGCPDIKPGFGLKHMKERLGMLNGTLDYDSGNGFLIVANIPIRWGEQN